MASKPKQIFIFDMSRNRSHLFFRYLGTHPDVVDIWHPFLAPFLFGPERMTAKTKNPYESEWTPAFGDATYDGSTKILLDAIKEAEDQGKIPVMNEHTQMCHKQDIALATIRTPDDIPDVPNPTVIPDQIFATLTPVFVIRHPIYSIPSNYVLMKQTSELRPGGEDWHLLTYVPIQRRLFDHFWKRDGKPPLLIDGDDIVWRTDEVGAKLAKALNIDPKGLSDTWEAATEEKRVGRQFPILAPFLQNINDSTGIQRPTKQPPEIDLDKTYQKWADEYGQEVSGQLRATVEQNMPHYEYMSKYKL